MKHFILVGSIAINCLNNEDWKGLEEALKDNCDGDLIAFDYSEINALQNLLNQLNGWSDFIELSESEIKEIEKNTFIVFNKSEIVKLPIYWSTLDFETLAIQNFNELKKNYANEFNNLDSWEQFYDKNKFAHELQQMISGHDANYGITWQTLEYYLGNCEIK